MLAGGIAHDFNNLLTGILGNAALAQTGLSPDSPTHHCLREIETAALRAADLCRQMLAFSGKGRFVMEAVRLNALVEEMAQVLKASLSAKIDVQLSLNRDLPFIRADANQLRQVITNVILNAAEAIGDKNGIIAISTNLNSLTQAELAQAVGPVDLTEGQYIVMEIRDNGCGMSAETLKKIFDPFYSTKFVGRGLGLAAVLGIVRGHQGAIQVRSEDGHGTTFRVFLPPSETPFLKATAHSTPRSTWQGSGTVLVVDDEPVVRSVAAQMLQTMGFNTLVASSGAEALELFRPRAAEMALVLLDLTMPGLDGVQVFEELSRIRSGVPVVLMSGFDEREALTRFAEGGLAGFLHKPFNLEALRAKLQAVLG